MIDDTNQRLKILFITEDDPMYVIKFFEEFFILYPKDEFELLGITIGAAFNESKIKTARRMFSFYGPFDFFRLLFKYLSVKARGQSIGSLAKKNSIPLIEGKSVNDPDYIAQVQELQPDVIVSVAAPEIFKKKILASARLGCINIHSGRLPKYRGMMPNFWQMQQGEKSATVTVHKMVPKLDAGDILATLEFPIKEKDTLNRIITETKREGAKLMIKVLRDFASGTIQSTALDMTDSSYFSFPKPQDVKKFKALGHSLL